VVKDRTGQDVLIVQSWEWGKSIGNLKVVFDDQGQLKSYSGAPVLIDESFPEDPYIASLLAAFKKPIEAMGSAKVGELETALDRSSGPNKDSLMGSVVADSVLDATRDQGSVAAFWNAGGVRASLEAGPVNYGQLVEVCPFGNTLVVLELTGAELIAALDHGVTGGGMLYPSRGFSYVYDRGAEAGKRIIEAKLNGKDIDPALTYRLTFSNFTSSGGDGHRVLAEAKGKRIETGFVDIDALVNYVKANSPVRMENEGRMRAKR
jgi:5'-nucleotidase